MKTNEVGHLNLRIPRKQHKALQQIALQENISVSQLVRKYIEKGMELDGYQTQMDLIRSQIREEIASQLQPRMERMIQISYKGSLYSIETAYLCAKALEGLVPPSNKCTLMNRWNARLNRQYV